LTTGRPPSPQRVQELKFLVPPGRSDGLASNLGRLLAPDPEFPDNLVVTTYFDTPSLAALQEKLNGDSHKRKVRLRWYEAPAAGAPAPGCFLEVKLRHGRLRWKLRAAAALEVERWRRLPLEHPSWIDLPRRLAPPEFGLRPGLVPTTVVRYRRRRFVDPRSGARVALDTGIHAAACHRGLFQAATAKRLRDAVLEVKTGDDLPPSLRWLVRGAGLRLQAFSKYAACLGALSR
jgi:hypothetical protein